MATVTAAEFNQRPSKVKRAAADEPVIITERDRPAFVLLRFDEYERLIASPADLASHLEMRDEIDFEIEATGVSIEPAEL